ncbi:16S rRNA (cytidine(1402)-2'-O)-methyltransferase [Schleiferiaceae bacterium]|nr:16S rRNA (cytidine(1402)-2'-O)-methyltransferase [Schleiferiaceae bacterium]
MAAALYVVPTPVGNLDDMTFRAIAVLKAADLILAEDTRTTGKLTAHFGIETPKQSFHMHNEHKVVQRYIGQLQGGATIALVSDAGTPGISDPGFLLIRAAAEAGIEIITLPGATAFVPALVSSGLPCDTFYFEGFLPPKKGRQSKLLQIAESTSTVILYESPHKIIKTLGQIEEFCGSDRPVALSREISKKFEETLRGAAGEVLAQVEQRGGVKGEIVLIIGGKTKQERKEKG